MNNIEFSQIRNRIAGSLYGGAYGDALGYAIEFCDWSTIKQKYGPKGLHSLETENGKALVSDDTQMTLFTAEGMCYGYFRSYEHQGGSVEGYVYQSYLCWLETQGYKATSLWDPVSRLLKNPDMHHRRAPGNTCISALLSGNMGTMKNPINNSKGCGGVMRTAPLGFVQNKNLKRCPFGDPLQSGAAVAAITHGHPLGWIPAGMLSDIVYRCIYRTGFISLDEIIMQSLNATVQTFCKGHHYFEKLIYKSILLAKQNQNADRETHVKAIESLGGGWVGEEALAIAIYAVLCHPFSIREALITAVNHSGDSDSTGSIAGNILGAYLGVDAIDSQVKDKLELTEEIETLCDTCERIIND